MKNETNIIKTIMSGIGFAAVSVFIVGCAGIPPHEEITRSSYVIKEAHDDGAEELAPLELRNANKSLEKAKAALNKKKYQEARDYAAQAELEAELAKAKTEALKRQKSAKEIKESIHILKDELKRYRPRFE